MLDIGSYSIVREEAEAIEVDNDFYEWLARSEFARIGKSELITNINYKLQCHNYFNESH